MELHASCSVNLNALPNKLAEFAAVEPGPLPQRHRDQRLAISKIRAFLLGSRGKKCFQGIEGVIQTEDFRVDLKLARLNLVKSKMSLMTINRSVADCSMVLK